MCMCPYGMSHKVNHFKARLTHISHDDLTILKKGIGINGPRIDPFPNKTSFLVNMHKPFLILGLMAGDHEEGVLDSGTYSKYLRYRFLEGEVSSILEQQHI